MYCSTCEGRALREMRHQNSPVLCVTCEMRQQNSPVLCVTYEMRQQTIAERHSCSLCFMYCSTYEGDVVQGKRHGHGTFRWKDNTMSYTGDWVQGLRTGKVSVVENL